MGPFSFLSKTPFCIGLIYLKVPSLLLNSEISFSNSGVLFFLSLRKFVFSYFCFRRVLEQNGQVHVTPMWTIQCLEFQTRARVWNSIHLEPECPDFTGASAPCHGRRGSSCEIGTCTFGVYGIPNTHVWNINSKV